MAITNKEILDEIETLKRKLPNGEFALMKKAVEDLQIDQKELKEDISELKERMLNPDDGIVARVNRNSDVRKYWEVRNEEVEGGFSHIKNLVGWQSAVNKALWILFTGIAGIIIKIIFLGN